MMRSFGPQPFARVALAAVMATVLLLSQASFAPAGTMGMRPVASPAAPSFASPVTQPEAVPVGAPAPFVIDHTSLALFERIPDRYIEAAGKMNLLLRHASVGANIAKGLDCLMNNFSRRPVSCDRGLPANDKYTNRKYDWTHWTFEYHAPLPNPNPGWYNKVRYFVDRVSELERTADYDAFAFTIDYVDGDKGSTIARDFFSTPPKSDMPNVADLEALQAAYPNQVLVWWTMNLSRKIGTPESRDYNLKLRAYAKANGKILVDIADIESHRPDGRACIDNQGRNLPAICQDYTDERNAGHLNARGQRRMAKAMWILMARLAGWDGKSE